VPFGDHVATPPCPARPVVAQVLDSAKVGKQQARAAIARRLTGGRDTRREHPSEVDVLRLLGKTLGTDRDHLPVGLAEKGERGERQRGSQAGRECCVEGAVAVIPYEATDEGRRDDPSV